MKRQLLPVKKIRGTCFQETQRDRPSQQQSLNPNTVHKRERSGWMREPRGPWGGRRAPQARFPILLQALGCEHVVMQAHRDAQSIAALAQLQLQLPKRRACPVCTSCAIGGLCPLAPTALSHPLGLTTLGQARGQFSIPKQSGSSDGIDTQPHILLPAPPGK